MNPEHTDRGTVLSAPPLSQPGIADEARSRDAFRELHGRRLHGFALLLTLGGRSEAAGLTAGALADGLDRIDTLRHPERAAAWLRARVLARAGRTRRSPAGIGVLEELGARRSVVDALDELGKRERAAVIARLVEGLELRDVGTIIGREGRALDRVLDRGIRRYVAALGAIDPQERQRGGPVTRRLEDAARRVIG